MTEATAIHKPRWYRLSPDRLILGLVAVQVLLLLSEEFQWFAFNEMKGWTVLIAVAAVCLAVVVMLFWLAASLLFRWRFQFSLRSLVVLVVAAAVPLGWFRIKMREAERQRQAVEAIIQHVTFQGIDYSHHFKFSFDNAADLDAIISAHSFVPDVTATALYGESLPDWYDIHQNSSITRRFHKQDRADIYSLFIDDDAKIAYFEMVHI